MYNFLLYVETNVPTKETETRSNAWIPLQNEDERRPQDHALTPPRPPRPPFGLDAVFPRRARLSRSHFPAALSGRRLSSAHFSVVVPTAARGYAVVVPKKVARLSAQRHRLKRVVLAALRMLPLPPALVVFPRASALQMNFTDLHAELAGLLSKIRR